MGLVFELSRTASASFPPSCRGGARTISRLAAVVGLAACVGQAAAQEGLGLSTPEGGWGRWSTRLTPQADTRGQVQSMGWLGDYVFTSPKLGMATGLRATGGVVWGNGSVRMASPETMGSRPALLGEAASQRLRFASTPDNLSEGRTAAYFGLGYTRANLRAGWRVNADIGVAWRLSPGNVKLGVDDAATPLEDVLRDARLAPLMHLSVSYSF